MKKFGKLLCELPRVTQRCIVSKRCWEKWHRQTCLMVATVSICKEKNAVSVKHRIVKLTEMRHVCTYILVQALRYPSSYVHIFSNSHLIIIAQHQVLVFVAPLCLLLKYGTYYREQQQRKLRGIFTVVETSQSKNAHTNNMVIG